MTQIQFNPQQKITQLPETNIYSLRNNVACNENIWIIFSTSGKYLTKISIRESDIQQ